MKLDEALEIGMQKLAEYEPRLKVTGTRAYGPHAAHLHERYSQLHLPPSRETVEQMIDTVMRELVAQEEDFCMSEPEPGLDTPVGIGHGPSLATVPP